MNPAQREKPAEPEAKRLRQAEILIAWVLRAGVLVCGSVILLGLLSRLFHVGGPTSESSRRLIAELLAGSKHLAVDPVPHAGQLAAGVLQWQPDSVMTLGLLLLIALPILRVAMTVVIFLHEKDWPFFSITLAVLAILLSGIFLGRAL